VAAGETFGCDELAGWLNERAERMEHHDVNKINFQVDSFLES
jgi:hypothetical protein